MAEIKFTTGRMQDVHNRMDEIVTQLQTSISNANEILGVISSNIQSDNIKSVLSSYVTTATEKCTETQNNLKLLDEYLVGKIGTYTAIDQAGVDSMSEVENLLSQLNV
jgi:hypothetical protein